MEKVWHRGLPNNESGMKAEKLSKDFDIPTMMLTTGSKK